MKAFSLPFGLIMFLILLGSTQAEISSVTGPNTVLLGGDAVISVETSDETNVSYNLLDPGNNSEASGDMLINGTDSITFNSSTVDELGVWRAILSDNASAYTHDFSVLEPIQFNIILLDADPHNATANKIVQTPSTVSVGAGFTLGGQIITQSGTLKYGNLTEADLSCDINGDNVLDKTYHVWISDPDTSGQYTMAFIDDDPTLNETTESGATPKTHLRKGDDALKCSAYTNLAPYVIEHIYPTGVVLVLPPGPGDRPYGPEDNVSSVILSYNDSDDPVPANISSFIVRYTNTSSGLIVEQDLNARLTEENETPINQTGADGFSAISLFNLSGFMSMLPDSGPGEYVFIINDVSTETYRIVPRWTATVIVGDPLTKTDKYDFRAGDSAAVGVETSAGFANLSIDVRVYNPDDNLDAHWTYSSAGGGSGIYYSNDSRIYIAGIDPSTLTPNLTVSDEGEWRVEVTVTSGNDERYFERPFVVKSYELTVFSILIPEDGGPGPDKEPEFNVMKPGGKAFIGVFATTFGVRGDLRDNLEEADVPVVDGNVFDAVNECNQSMLSFRITDSNQLALTDYPSTPGMVTDVDNVYNILEDHGPGADVAPSQFHGQCMVYLSGGPNATGYYSVSATLTLSLGNETKNVSGNTVVDVNEVETDAHPWDLTSNHHRWHFNPGDNVTFKVKAKNLYLGEDVPSDDFVSIKLIEVFNPDYGGPVTDLIEGYGWIRNHSLGGENASILWIKLGNTTGFHHIEYEVTVTINASGTLTNSTARGHSGVETRLYDIKGHPSFERNTEYFRPDEDIDFIVEVWSSNGPASGVSVYIDRVVLISRRDTEVNFTAARATTDSEGRANITLRSTSSLWETGDYDVRIRVKDAQDNVDYGWGWFDVKTFQVILMPIKLKANGTRCEGKSLAKKRMGDDDEMERGGPPQITDDQRLAVVGVNSSGVFSVTPLLEKSFLFQITNLNGEPVFRDIQPDTSNISTCNLSTRWFTTAAKYFTLYTGDLGGMYEFEVVAQDESGRIGTGYSEFFVTPFDLSVYLMHRGEPVFSKGDVLTFKAETGTQYNVTGVSVKRLVKIGGAEEIIPGAASAMSNTLTWLNNASSTRKFTLAIPTNVSGIRKGEYIIQIEVTVTDDSGVNQSLVYNQWVMIKSFTYSLANILRSWADTYNTTETYDIGYGCTADGDHASECINESIERGQYSFNYESCPYPIINASERCAFVNASDVRRRVLELWSDCSDCMERYNEFLSYYNRSGNLSVFNGFGLIVGPISFERASSANLTSPFVA